MNQRAPEQSSLQIGLFMPNCSNLYSFSTYKPVPDDWTFRSNKAIAIAAEDAGTRMRRTESNESLLFQFCISLQRTRVRAVVNAHRQVIHRTACN